MTAHGLPRKQKQPAQSPTFRSPGYDSLIMTTSPSSSLPPVPPTLSQLLNPKGKALVAEGRLQARAQSRQGDRQFCDNTRERERERLCGAFPTASRHLHPPLLAAPGFPTRSAGGRQLGDGHMHAEAGDAPSMCVLAHPMATQLLLLLLLCACPTLN